MMTSHTHDPKQHQKGLLFKNRKTGSTSLYNLKVCDVIFKYVETKLKRVRPKHSLESPLTPERVQNVLITAKTTESRRVPGP